MEELHGHLCTSPSELLGSYASFNGNVKKNPPWCPCSDLLIQVNTACLSGSLSLLDILLVFSVGNSENIWGHSDLNKTCKLYVTRKWITMMLQHVSQVSHCIIPISIIDFKIGPSLILAKFPIFFYTITLLDALEKYSSARMFSTLGVRFLCILNKDIYYSNGQYQLSMMTNRIEWVITNEMKGLLWFCLMVRGDLCWWPRYCIKFN